jgi:hypothetical protein
MDTDISLSLVSHTNVGKTTLARTLLWRDVGEVRDAPHVTEFSDTHELLRAPDGSGLMLWDTPGFGDSVRLVRRLRQAGNPLGWFLSEVWDRWRDRPFWASQQVLRHVREHSDVLLYLVNAAEPPAAAGYVAAEMELLAWVGKPVLVLLNQIGAPQPVAAEAAERQAWVDHLARWPLVRGVLPLDAFARCWVQEGALWRAVHDALPVHRRAAMAALQRHWWQQRLQVFQDSMAVQARGLATLALHREALDGAGHPLRRLGAALGLDRAGDDALVAARGRLAERLDAEGRAGTDALLRLHGLAGSAGPLVLQRVDGLFRPHLKVDESRAAWAGGLVSGALGGLAADLAAGGLTLGAGVLAGGLLGVLGGAGAARGLNVVRGTRHSWVALGPAALQPLLQATLLRYLAVAHFGRGRGDWAEGEAPPHWADAVARALALDLPALQAAWDQAATAGAPAALAGRLQPLLADCTRRVLQDLYPGAWWAQPE